MSLFESRVLTIATMHGKEQCMAPILERALGVSCVVPRNFNTDSFGSFCGTIQRTNDSISTARLKCLSAMSITRTNLAVASEGSFGPHPESFFGSVDEEIVLLLDKKNDLEIIGRAISGDTNFGGRVVRTEPELFEFAVKAMFPSHGLMLRRIKEHPIGLQKGISDKETLLMHFRKIVKLFDEAYVETDMRAMLNPSRMKVIAAATRDLVRRTLSNCPVCSTPGFGITEIRPGLPCERCGSPTRSVSGYVFSCRRCGNRKEEANRERKSEDPLYCDHCNP